jgi:hypothetical protein
MSMAELEKELRFLRLMRRTCKTCKGNDPECKAVFCSAVRCLEQSMAETNKLNAELLKVRMMIPKPFRCKTLHDSLMSWQNAYRSAYLILRALDFPSIDFSKYRNNVTKFYKEDIDRVRKQIVYFRVRK